MWNQAFKSLLVLCVAISLCDGQICAPGDPILIIANQCTDPDELFNNTVDVLPGANVTLNCSVVDTGVRWNSSRFDMPLRIDDETTSKVVSGIEFQLDTLSTSPLCYTATAIITNIQETSNGLDVTCYNIVGDQAFTSTVVVDVLDPPGPVTFKISKGCNSIIITWTALSDEPCPITGYHVNISGMVMPVSPDQTNYTYDIDDGDCGATLDMGVFAISAAGNGEMNNTNITAMCTPTDISVESINDTNAVVTWTHTVVPGVTDYKIMSMTTNGQFESAKVPVSMSMGSVEMSDFAVSVTFTVTSLNAEGEACFSSQTILPQIKEPNVVSDDSEMGSIIFPFQHSVTASSITWSPDNGSCAHSVMNNGDIASGSITVDCAGLTNGVSYTVTVQGTLNVSGQPLPFTFSEMLSPMVPTTPPTESSALTTPVETSESEEVSSLSLIVGVVVAVIVIILLVIVVIVIIAIVYTKKKAHKASLGCNTKDDSDDPVALVVRQDPTTGEAGNPAYGETYAVVTDKPRRTAPTTPQADTNYQDPSIIQREQAPTGDLYAMVNKESKPMYSEVQKQPDRVYADLDLKKKDEQGGASHKPASSDLLFAEVQQQIRQL